MNFRFRLSSYLGMLVFIIILPWIAVNSYLSDTTSLSNGIQLLFADEEEAAKKTFLRLKDSIWIGDQASEAMCISAILMQEESTISTDVRHDISRFATPLILNNHFAKGEWSVASNLARYCQVHEIAIAEDYLKAIDLEISGRINDFAAIPAPVTNSAIASRMEELRTSGFPAGSTVVRDRKGELLGHLFDGSLVLQDSIDHSALQPIYKKIIESTDIHHKAISLSLDYQLSLRARDLLSDLNGSIVIVKPISGEVLVAVSNRQSNGGKSGSDAFEQMLEPASISKLITTVAGYRADIDVNDELTGKESVFAKRYKGGILYNLAELGTLTGLDQAMAGSCNVAFADIGILVGWSGITNELQNFGFEKDFEDKFAFGRITKFNGNDRQLANISIGLEYTRTTPLHAALIALTFANEGNFVDPGFVHSQNSFLGYTELEKPENEKRKIIKDEWLPIIIQAMEAVTDWGGTARFIDNDYYPVAMKTGTGGNRRQGFHINYIGFCPVDTPAYAFSVRVTNHPRSQDARRAGYRVTKRLIEILSDTAR